MASISDLTINVGISISRDTVDRCLQLLSIYLTDNPDIDIRSFEFHEVEGIKRRAELFRPEHKGGGNDIGGGRDAGFLRI